MSNLALFNDALFEPWAEVVCEDVYLLHHYALAQAETVWQEIQEVQRIATPRILYTPGGKAMSVRTCSCGKYGWHSDQHGYRYICCDPQTHSAWPEIPTAIATLSQSAAAQCNFPDFVADSCLINQYLPGSKMSLHQDKDEQDFVWPIVSISLGLPATFLFGGSTRNAPTIKIPLEHGDVLVWGRSKRLNFHGVSPIKPDIHPMIGGQRINLTLRRAF